MSYTLTPIFVDSVAPAAAPREAETRDVVLPVTTVPAQVPKIVGAGYALSPKIRVHWIEDGDHSFKPRASSGRTDAQNMAEAIAAVREFVATLP